ncbi:MAG: biliverdin-producing heme oxygenase [Cyclobacteriaceae bacterium]
MRLLEAVKIQTRTWHNQMEALAFSDKIAAGTLHLNEYQTLILAHYVFHKKYEKYLAAIPSLVANETLNLENRLKEKALFMDLKALNLENQVFDFTADFVPQTLEEGLGCLYVTEGSTLGGNVIRKKLDKMPAISEQTAMHYYGYYGNEVGLKWKQYRQVAEQVVIGEQQKQDFFRAASATFKAYAACMQQSIDMRYTPKAQK